MPTLERLLPAYQPSAYSSDHSVLRRARFTPPSTYGPGPWPTVLTIHPGQFRGGDVFGVPSQRWADKDLADAGFLVFSIDYRLAPPGFVKNQDPDHTDPADGRPPEQSNDVKQQILAAYNDTDCNGAIFLLGGSAGGTHALWCALDSAPTVPGWPVPGIQVVKAAVGLSGPYDLPSRVGDDPVAVAHFAADAENYTNTTDGDPGAAAYQYSVSPIALVAAATNIPPVRLYATEGDPVPYQQAEEMRDSLIAHGGVDLFYYKLPGNLHAFNYWHTMNPITGQYVSQDVINFFTAHIH